jgi:hypothetical protein
VLQQSVLPPSRYVIEVVTDKGMSLPSWVVELVVPANYAPPHGCKYKARALNYAVAASAAREYDWVVHLDEETRFDLETLDHIFAHCQAEAVAVETGPESLRKRWASVGQGVIYYNTAGIENYLTALADTIRVSDDFSKFALQYRVFGFPLIGMHGSFVVARNSLELAFGWDWGLVGSITEDTYLAMKMAAAGVRFSWVAGCMYEQSPFTCLDFAKQRARWFSGLWLCVFTHTLPLWQRFYMGTHLVSWTACPLLTLLTWVNLLSIFPRTSFFITLMSVVFAVPFWSYCLGYILGVRPCSLRHGWLEWTLMFCCHVSLIPVYTVMETWGVLRGILDRSTYTQFHVVKKEGQNVAREAQATGISSSVAVEKQGTEARASSVLDHAVVRNDSEPSVCNQQHGATRNDLVYLNPPISCVTDSRSESTGSEVESLEEVLSRRSEALTYWMSVLGAHPEPLDLVTDMPRRQV